MHMEAPVEECDPEAQETQSLIEVEPEAEFDVPEGQRVQMQLIKQ